MKKNTKTTLFHFFFLFALLFVFQSGTAQSGPLTFFVKLGTAGGDANNIEIWSTGNANNTTAVRLPSNGDGDTVIINNGKTVTIPGGVTLSAATITINLGGSINFAAGENLTQNNLTCTNTLTVNGTLTMRGSSRVTCRTLTRGVSSSIVNQATLGIFEFNGAATGTNIISSFNWPINQTFANVEIAGASPNETLICPPGFRVNGNLNIRTGNLNLSQNYNAKTLTTAQQLTGLGTLTIAQGRTLTIRGTNSLPNDFANYVFQPFCTVNYAGGTQTVLSKNLANQNIPYYNLTITTSSTVAKTLDGDVFVKGILNFFGENSVLALGSHRLTFGGDINDESTMGGIRGGAESSLTYNRFFTEFNTTDNPIIRLDQSEADVTNVLKNLTIITQATNNDTNNPFTLQPATKPFIGNKINLLGTLTLGAPDAGGESFFGKLQLLVDNANNGELIFKSNELTTAILAPVLNPALSFIEGNVTVERFIPSSEKRAFRLLSSSTTGGTILSNWQEGGTSVATAVPGFGTHITGAVVASTSQASLGIIDDTTGLDRTTSGNKSMFTYNNLNNSSVTGVSSWTGVGSTLGDLIGGTPYLLFVRGDRNVDLGTNASGDVNGVSTTLRSNGTLAVGNVVVNDLISTVLRWNLVGNPYQSAVDMTQVLTGTNGLSPLYYRIFDSKIGSQTARGGYVTVNLSDNSNNVSGSVANQFLQPNQACFVRTDGANPVLTFTEASKTTATNYVPLFKSAALNLNSIPKIRVSLFDPASLAINGKAYDGSVVSFSDAYSNAVNEQDASKSGGFPDESFGIANGAIMLDFESRALPIPNEIIQLRNVYNFSSTDASDTQIKHYVIRINVANLNGVGASLVDTYTNTTTPLNLDADTAYAYSINKSIAASINPNRFYIIFSTNLGVNENINSFFTLYPNPVKNNEFTILLNENLSKSKVQVTLYNVLGQEVYSANKAYDSSGSIKITPNVTLQKGLYLVKVTSDKKSFTKKLIFE